MPRLTLSNGKPSEYAIQKAVFDWIRTQPQIRDVIFHIPNEGKRSWATGKALKQIGMLAGVADILITYANHGYHGCWIELKSEKGIVSVQQHAFRKTQLEFGYFATVCYSIEETIKMIEWYCYGD